MIQRVRETGTVVVVAVVAAVSGAVACFLLMVWNKHPSVAEKPQKAASKWVHPCSIDGRRPSCPEAQVVEMRRIANALEDMVKFCELPVAIDDHGSPYWEDRQ